MLVDVHSHLTFPQFAKDIDQVIQRAKLANVSKIITSGTSLESNKAAIELSKKYNIVEASLGVYPTEVKGTIDQELEFIKKNKNNMVAIGECGLDYLEENKKSSKKQRENFEKVIELAKKLKKPLIIHSRKAESEVLDIIETLKPKKVLMHCFTPNMKLVKRAEDLGCYFSIPTVITRLQHFQTLVNKVSFDKILTETDAPYLSPFKSKRNEPAFIVETIKKISEIKKLEKEEVEKIIFMNYQKFFL
jgi:TatD DNase family protein